MRESGEYRQVAQLHVRCLGRGFLATLGEGFLALMYEAIDRADDAVLLTEAIDGRIVGFVTGASGMGTIYLQMLRSPVRLALGLAPALVRPARLRRIVDILRYSGGQTLPAGLPEHELLSLAVASEQRGQGVAERLYLRLIAEFLAQRVEAFRIIVGEPLAPAHKFYRRMGAVATAELEVHGGERSTAYVHRLDTQSGHR